jgi:dihydropyrimidine dehydrogenase (NAD+) subunit PreA
VGCNLCALVCPVPSCITMKEIDTGRPAFTWKDRAREQRAEAGGVAYTPSLWRD